MTKRCKTCTMDKPVAAFAAHRTTRDRLRSDCRACVAVRSARHYQANRAKVLERCRQRDKTAAGKAAMIRHATKWQNKNRPKIRAQDKLKYHVRVGHIKRQPCERCGNPKTHGHHEDYDKPLEVVWLCARCHKARHAELKAAGVTP